MIWWMLPLVKDGDFLSRHFQLHALPFEALTRSRFPRLRVMLHKAMVDNGDVRFEDLIGDDGADTAADLGRLRQQDYVITKLRAPSLRVTVDHATLLGPPFFFWRIALGVVWFLPPSPGMMSLSGPTVSIYSLSFPPFLATLHWP